MSAAPQPRAGGTSARPGDGSPLRDWLRCLGGWLAGPLRCRSLRLVWIPADIPAAQWTDDIDALQASTLEADGDHMDGSGWLLPLDEGSSGVLCLFCSSQLEPAQRAGVEPDLERSARAARAAWELANPCATEDATLALVDRDQVRHSLHELRNALNSLMMNAATLTYRAEAIPEPLRRFATQLQQDGERCAGTLQELQALLDPRPEIPPRRPS